MALIASSGVTAWQRVTDFGTIGSQRFQQKLESLTKMTTHPEQKLSAPACQLCQVGTAGTKNILMRAVKVLEDKDLSFLEDELGFYAQTGLIGIRMSELLGKLDDLSFAEAA